MVTPSQGDAGEGARPASAGRAPAAEPAGSPAAAGAAAPPGSAAPPGAAAEPVLRLEGIGKHFGPVEALSDVNLDVPAGQVTALVGDNGAGKTTLIKCIAGIPARPCGDRDLA